MTKYLKSSFLIATGALFGILFARQGPLPKPMLDAKLANIVVTTWNMPAEVDFYQKTFGFKSFFQDKTSCFLKAGSVNLVFVASTERAKKTRNLCLDFGVKDLASSLAALKAAGVKVDNSDPAILKFEDPDGNVIEVVHG